MSKPGWGAALLGEPTDLEDWAYTLQEPFDPWVEIHGAETMLRSASFDELESAIEVRDRAAALIERLNGAVALSQQARHSSSAASYNSRWMAGCIEPCLRNRAPLKAEVRCVPTL
jgi:hypothetical protein